MHLYEVVIHLVAASDLLGLQLGAYNTFRLDILLENIYVISARHDLKDDISVEMNAGIILIYFIKSEKAVKSTVFPIILPHLMDLEIVQNREDISEIKCK